MPAVPGGPSSRGTSPTKSAKSPKGCCTMKVQAALPPGSSGRPGQRSEASTGAGRRSSASRRLAADSFGSFSGAGGCGVVLSTLPTTALGR